MPEFTIPLGEIINNIFDQLIPVITPFFKSVSNGLEVILNGFEQFLLLFPPLILAVAAAILVWLFVNKKLGIFTAVAAVFIYGLGLWEQTIGTLAIVLSGTLISLVVGIPLGILASQSDSCETILRPILDFMQTLPSFVYLIPAVIFFGLGKVSAVVATLIFAMPPAIRLTNLGIRQVPADMVEAAKSFGSTRFQILKYVQLPLALPTIMAGVNQCIMMALSMSVIAAMIGAGGLGRDVLKAMQTVDIGLGVEGGLGIVLLAILLDRITENVTKKHPKSQTA
jgi:glycine betaine/proline transport system permease protein